MTLTLSDLFCGAGGSSLGAVDVPGVELRLAANHSRLAIATHSTNFPDADHACCDISQADPRRFPRTDLLWASPECTNFSTAKNHQQAAAALTLWNPEELAERSRATMWDVCRFAEVHRYKAIVVENVVEARCWEVFDAWRLAMELLGYRHRISYFNSMFAHSAARRPLPPVPQSRDRMYATFWPNGAHEPDLEFHPAARCEQCGDVAAVQTWKLDGKPTSKSPDELFELAHARADQLVRQGKRKQGLRRWGLYRQQYFYACPRCHRPVAPWAYAASLAIDWSLPSTRIGDRDQPLAANTLERIRKGIARYGATPTLVPLSYQQDPGRTPRPVMEPMPTQTGRSETGLALPLLVQVAGNTYERPGSTCRTRPVTEPMRAQTATLSEALIQIPVPLPLIAELRGGGSDARPVTQPLSTVTARGNHHMLITAGGYIVSNYSPGRVWPADAEPLGTVTGIDHHGLLQPPVLVDTYHRTATPQPVSDPLTTLTTVDRHGLVEAPDGTPGGWPAAVEDCRYRMLEPPEQGAAMAFPPRYRVHGCKRDQTRQYGQAVTPPVATMLLERLVEIL
jgi:DNA (cytosine-5)-methyltransferase 1